MCPSLDLEIYKQVMENCPDSVLILVEMKVVCANKKRARNHEIKNGSAVFCLRTLGRGYPQRLWITCMSPSSAPSLIALG